MYIDEDPKTFSEFPKSIKKNYEKILDKLKTLDVDPLIKLFEELNEKLIEPTIGNPDKYPSPRSDEDD
ncbi:hypothetical protein D3C76_1771420 [compost metagenome]